MTKHLLHDEVERALHRDALAEAEQITGKSYKDDNETAMLGLASHIALVQDRRRLMAITDDTEFSCPLDRYLRIAEDIGFRVVLKEPFYDDQRRSKETLFILWWNVGALLVFDTYGNHINGGKFYYNLKPNEGIWDRKSQVISSGRFWLPKHIDASRPASDVLFADKIAYDNWAKLWHQHAIWVGDHDCREALRHHTRNLQAHGSFVTPWVESPFLWITNYVEMRPFSRSGRSYSDEATQLTEARLLQLPTEVQTAILPAWREHHIKRG